MILFAAPIVCYSQYTYDHEKYYPLLGKTKNEVRKTLKRDFGVKAKSYARNKDSVRLVFFSQNRELKYTIFIFDDTCSYIGVTCSGETAEKLVERFKTKYFEPSREAGLVDGFVETFKNETQEGVAFFEDTTTHIGFLVVKDLDEGETDSTFIFWSLFQSDW